MKVIKLNVNSRLKRARQQIFSWKSHVEAITSKATQRIYFLKQLRRVGVPQSNLLHFYTGVIRPVLECAAPIWNHLLSKSQIDQIEAIQRRALRIIYSYTNDMPYTNALYCASIPSLVDRRAQLCRKFFLHQSYNPHLVFIPFYLPLGIL